MRTPAADVELAQGFLLTEGVIGGRDDLRTVRYCNGEGPDGLNTYIVVDVALAPGLVMPSFDLTRRFAATSSCGVCGKASLDAIRTTTRHPPAADAVVLEARLLRGLPD